MIRRDLAPPRSRHRRRPIGAALGLALAFATLPAASAAEPWRAGELYEEVASTLAARYYDEEFRRSVLPDLVEESRPAALAAADLAAERRAVQQLLSQVPASHLALLSEHAFLTLNRELRNERNPTLGVELVERGGEFFVHRLFEGGPAELAGLLRGDRVTSIDGVPPSVSPRLDWRTDDAYLPDPPIHLLIVESAEVVRFGVERVPGRTLEIEVLARHDSAFAATERSSQVFRHGEIEIGYVHLWFIQHHGLDRLLRRLLIRDFAGCDALVLDLRGRGGSASMVGRLVRLFVGTDAVWQRPVVALVDRFTRSAKEVLAHQLREARVVELVGEETAGAVIPASFARVGEQAILMFPSSSLGRYTRLLEGRGLPPDLPVRDAGSFATGADPILAAGYRRAIELGVAGARRLPDRRAAPSSRR